MADGAVLVDDHEFPAGERGAVVPRSGDAFIARSAVDRVDDHALRKPVLAGLPGIDWTLGEGFVAGDEDGLVGPGIGVPCQVRHGALDDGAAVFLAAVGLEREHLFADLVEIAGERLDLADVVVSDVLVVVAVFKKRDFDKRRLAIAAGVDEGVDDFPKLGFRLIDQAVHAVGGVEQQGDLDLVFPGEGSTGG